MVLSFPAVSAEAVALNPNHPQTYTVVLGDNLWDIAGRFLAQPWQWPVVWQVNPQIQNPNRIYPGDVITLTDHDGHPLLGLRRGGQEPGGRLVKLSPSARESPHENAIAPISLDVIRKRLKPPTENHRVVTPSMTRGGTRSVAMLCVSVTKSTLEKAAGTATVSLFVRSRMKNNAGGRCHDPLSIRTSCSGRFCLELVESARTSVAKGDDVRMTGTPSIFSSRTAFRRHLRCRSIRGSSTDPQTSLTRGV